MSEVPFTEYGKFAVVVSALAHELATGKCDDETIEGAGLALTSLTFSVYGMEETLRAKDELDRLFRDSPAGEAPFRAEHHQRPVYHISVLLMILASKDRFGVPEAKWAEMALQAGRNLLNALFRDSGLTKDDFMALTLPQVQALVDRVEEAENELRQ